MFAKRIYDVAVVGAGPVGLISALLLHKSGANVVVLESEPTTETRSYALALNPDALAVIKELGLLDQVLEEALQVETMRFHIEGKHKGDVHIAGYDEAFPWLAVLGQDRLESILENALTAKGVPIFRNHRVCRVEQDSTKATLYVDELDECLTGYAVVRMDWQVVRSHEFNCSFVIGADGHNSAVRRSLKTDFPVFDQSQQFAVFEFDTNWKPDGRMHIALSQGLTNVLWPLPGGSCRWSFELTGDAKDIFASRDSRGSLYHGNRNLNVAALKGLLAVRAPWFDGTVNGLYWSTVVKFDKRLVTSFGRNRVWLAGDAAHITGPVGVQSMNMGILEAGNLTAIITDCLRGKRSVAELELYGREALANWEVLSGNNVRMEAGAQMWPELRPYMPRLLQCLPGKPRAIQRLAEQVHVMLV
ncbi:MAG: FAD-dependent monooxygenase [Verrucomicrobia bacterium]|nr:FAD-dependent monooxygenase [Verrucomicrobiota bacterium]